MKNRNMVGLKSCNILLIFGTAIVGLLSLEPSQMVWASIVEGSNTSNSNQERGGGCNEDGCLEAIGHINEAKSSLQNGDTEGAQRHLDLAKQALSCSPPYTTGC
ncbi:MAG: YfdX family protein [Candidatus Nitrosocosmicus sp.]|nr:YfdX family protein [Candidatus Nitrosocosmicus sp.]